MVVTNRNKKVRARAVRVIDQPHFLVFIPVNIALRQPNRLNKSHFAHLHFQLVFAEGC